MIFDLLSPEGVEIMGNLGGCLARAVSLAYAASIVGILTAIVVLVATS